MTMMFPGMDPYLEHPLIWPSVHARLIVYVADQIGPLIRPRYATTIEERVYVQGPERDVMPDVWIKKDPSIERPISVGTALAEVDVGEKVKLATLELHETYLGILDLYAEQRLVTIIEVVSPTNKYAGAGREAYRKKQQEILSSGVHLVEIDLLRQGNHVVAVPEYIVRSRGDYDYLISINRAYEQREEYEFFPRRLRERLPRIPIPLAAGDSEIPYDLQAGLDKIYEAGGYRDRLKYELPCQPPLTPDDQAWSDALIKEKS